MSEQSERCETCRFYRPTNLYAEGERRRHAPIHKALEPSARRYERESAWPTTQPSDWCGDWHEKLRGG